jgi:hypothetical protein
MLSFRDEFVVVVGVLRQEYQVLLKVIAGNINLMEKTLYIK